MAPCLTCLDHFFSFLALFVPVNYSEVSKHLFMYQLLYLSLTVSVVPVMYLACLYFLVHYLSPTCTFLYTIFHKHAHSCTLPFTKLHILVHYLSQRCIFLYTTIVHKHCIFLHSVWFTCRSPSPVPTYH